MSLISMRTAGCVMVLENTALFLRYISGFMTFLTWTQPLQWNPMLLIAWDAHLPRSSSSPFQTAFSQLKWKNEIDLTIYLFACSYRYEWQLSAPHHRFFANQIAKGVLKKHSVVVYTPLVVQHDPCYAQRRQMQRAGNSPRGFWLTTGPQGEHLRERWQLLHEPDLHHS